MRVDGIGNRQISGSSGRFEGGSARVVEVCLRFGVPMAAPAGPSKTFDRQGLSFRPGSLTLITGPSGAGKTSLLIEIAQKFPTSRFVHQIQFPTDVAVLDAIAPTRPLAEALGLLTACGLGEPMLWIRRFHQISAGEQFRAQLARAIWLQRRSVSGVQTPLNPPLVRGDFDGAPFVRGEVVPLLCDEFGAILHRRLAKAMAFNLRRLVTREKLALVVATSHEDLGRDLCPDQVIRLPLAEQSDPIEGESGRRGEGANKSKRVFSMQRQFRIERGTLSDYATFSSMHYRQRAQVGFVDKVFVMREHAEGEPVGIVVYGHPALELTLRNKVTLGRFVRNATRLNRELRVLKRLIIHPDIRGCGLGHWLIAKTLPMVETRFVECLATMGAINPVFEKAGMRRIGVCEAPASRDAAVKQLRAAGADPLRADFVAQVCRRPAVRRLVARSVFDWYRGTTGGGETRVAKQTPTTLAQTFRQLAGSQPVYYIWGRDEAAWNIIDRGTGELSVRECSATGT